MKKTPIELTNLLTRSDEAFASIVLALLHAFYFNEALLERQCGWGLTTSRTYFFIVAILEGSMGCGSMMLSVIVGQVLCFVELTHQPARLLIHGAQRAINSQSLALQLRTKRRNDGVKKWHWFHRVRPGNPTQ